MTYSKKTHSMIRLSGLTLLLTGCGAINDATVDSKPKSSSSTSASSLSSALSSSISSANSMSSILSSSTSSLSSALSSSISSTSSTSSTSSISSSASSSSSVVADSTPADFSFTAQTDVELGSQITSNTVTISDINVAIPITISGGEYSINGGAFTASAGTITNGQTLSLRLFSSASEALQTIATATLSTNISKKFTVTTKTTPLKTLRLEAENFSKVGNTTAFFEASASNNNALGSINQTGNGFQFTATQKTESVLLAYRTNGAATVSVKVNSSAKDNFVFASTDAQTTYSTIALNQKLAKGDSISFTFVSGGNLILDYVELLPSPFQMVGTLAKAAAFNGDGLTIDKNGNIFVGTSKGATVKRVTPSGDVTLYATFAGGTSNGSDIDSLGNLYVANEGGNIIHKITPAGVLSDYVTGLDGPASIYIDENDNLIVGLYGAVSTSPGAKVIKIAPDKTITTLASGGGLTNVVGVAGDGKGRYFAANFLTGEIFEVTNGVVKQIGAANTRVNHMKYAGDYLYLPNPLDNVVRRMDLNGNLELVAGAKFGANSVDGPSLLATFARPNSVDISADGKTLYILDFNTGDVRTISMGQ